MSKKRKKMIGKEIYIRELRTFGQVVEVDENGQPTKAKIQTEEDGKIIEKIIDLVGKSIKVLSWFERLLLVIGQLFQIFKKG